MATLLRTQNVRIRVRDGSPEGSAPYLEDDTLAGGAVVVGGDAPAAVASDQHPGRAHQSLARDSVLPREDDPVLADHDGRVAGKKADVTGRAATRDPLSGLTVVAGNLYRLLALKLTRYQNATPDKIWRHFLDATGTLHITPGGVTCAAALVEPVPVTLSATGQR